MTASNPDPAAAIRESLDTAREGPGRLRALTDGLDHRDCARKPGVGKLSLLEHVWHMLDMETQVFGARLRRVLAETDPRLEPLDVEEHAVRDEDFERHDISEIVARWEAARAENIALVEGTGPGEWSRTARHPQLGKATFVDMVRRWSRHDAEHLRQIEILSLNCRERNLP